MVLAIVLIVLAVLLGLGGLVFAALKWLLIVAVVLLIANAVAGFLAPGRSVIHDPGYLAEPRGTVLARQQRRFGGMKLGSAFFGWLTATGMAVLLISALAAAGVAFGVATSPTVDQAVQ